MTVAMDREMNERVYDINNDDAVRAVLLSGEGDRAFCAGATSPTSTATAPNWQYRNRFDARKDYARAVWQIRKPSSRPSTGTASAGGSEMACASDVRIASPDATFAAGEINWGWHGGSGATQLLTRAIGPGHASRMLLTGDRIDADTAVRIGLGPGARPAHVAAGHRPRLARTIAARAPIATQQVKHMVRIAQSTSLEVGLLVENDSFTYCMSTADAAEGRAAFAEKRAPKFRGE
jgi:enoyl-CoA hydratase/carnithine racemase